MDYRNGNSLDGQKVDQVKQLSFNRNVVGSQDLLDAANSGKHQLFQVYGWLQESTFKAMLKIGLIERTYTF